MTGDELLAELMKLTLEERALTVVIENRVQEDCEIEELILGDEDDEYFTVSWEPKIGVAIRLVIAD